MSPVPGSPRVSVIVTCYNLGRYLDEAVDSVLAQSFQDFEIIVVDDGSTDPETRALLAGYRRPKTRVVAIDNRGLPGARNEGIRRTTGAYVCALDADDRLAPTYFEKAVALLDRDASVAFVSHWLRTFADGSADEPRDSSGDGDGAGRAESHGEEWTPRSADFPALLDRNTINGAALVRRGALEAVGLFDESMRRGCEDWDLWIGLVERGLRGVILPEVLFFYRRRPDSMTRAMLQGRTHVELYRYLIEKHRASFEAHLPELLLRREIDRVTALREAHDLELDCDTALGLEIERLRDGFRVAAGKLERAQRDRAAAEELQRRADAVAARDARLAEQNAELARRAGEIAARDGHLAAQAIELSRRQTELELRHAEVEALRASWSWRLTAPLRAVYARLRRAG